MATADSTTVALNGIAVEYRGIPGQPGYRVGSDGSVWSCHRWNPVASPEGVWRQLKPWPVNPKKKYLAVGLLGGRRALVHRLVALAFIGSCPAGFDCCHNNGNPRDNRPENLRWDSRKGNVADAARHNTKLLGTTVPTSRLNDELVRQLRAEYAAGGISFSRLGAKHGVAGGTVRSAVRRVTWWHVT